MARRVEAVLSALDERRVAILVGLGVLTMVVGVAYSLSLGDELRYLDERWNFSIADNLLDGDGFSINGRDETTYRPPGYPVLILPFVALGAGAEVLRVVNFVALAATGGVVYLLVRQFARPAFGLLAAAATAFYPFSIYTAGTLYPQILATLPLVVAVWLLQREVGRPGRDGGTVRVLAVTGLLLGVSVMIVPNHLFLVLVMAAWTAWVLARAGRAVLVPTVVLLAAALVLPVAWTVRNVATHDELFFISSNSGHVLLVGNSENTTANNGPSADITRYVEEADARGYDEFERDRYYRSEAIDWITSHKAEAAGLYLRKLVNYFNASNDLYEQSEESPARDAIAYAAYLPVLALLVVRLALLRRVRPVPVERLVLLLYLSNALFMAIFFTRVRYRLPLDILLFAALAIFLGRWWASREGAGEPEAAPAAADQVAQLAPNR